MRHDESEKKDDRISVAVPGRIAAWVRDRARFVGMSPSQLCFDWIMEKLQDQSGLRGPSERIPEIDAQLEAAEAALRAARKRIGLLRSQGRNLKEETA